MSADKEKRVFEGTAAECEDGWIIDSKDVVTYDQHWLNGLQDKRVRITVEVLKVSE